MSVKNLNIEQLWSLFNLLSAILELIHLYKIESIYFALYVTLIVLYSKDNNKKDRQ